MNEVFDRGQFVRLASLLAPGFISALKVFFHSFLPLAIGKGDKQQQ